jgi:poly-gamma-glutamate capsule biosynthesis protein CapA/YwtB (metallophosphatase superfamily)
MRERITVTAVGDIFLGGGVEDTIGRKGPDYIFDLVRPFLQSDIVVGNLESPISAMEVTGEDDDLMIARPGALDGLKGAGFNAISLANNHIMDFGLAALQDTLKELEKRGIGMAGAGLNEADARRPLEKIGGKNVVLLSYYGMGKGGNLAVIPQHGTRSGALGENGGHNSGEISKVIEDIQNARKETDIVLVAVHWGFHGMDLPMKHQVELAYQMIDHGAKVILGSGPHVLQPVERYNDGLIAYSLGNFVFDLRTGQPSMILDISFMGGDIDTVRIIPILMRDEHRPAPIDPVTDEELYETIQSLLIDQLEDYASDAAALSEFRLRSLTPTKVLKKLIWRDHGVYPLSFYLRCLGALIKERFPRKGIT